MTILFGSTKSCAQSCAIRGGKNRVEGENGENKKEEEHERSTRSDLYLRSLQAVVDMLTEMEMGMVKKRRKPTSSACCLPRPPQLPSNKIR